MKRYNNSRILCFGDTHSPFHNKGCLSFLKQLKEEYKPDRVIMNGDLSDSYYFSAFTKDCIAGSFREELLGLRQFSGELHEIFPEMVITDSNHDARLWRKSTQNGIPREMLVTYKEMIGAKKFKGWKQVEDIILTVDKTREPIYIAHTRAGTTMTCSRQLGMSVVTSHKHNSQGIQFWSNGRKNFFAADTGCLIDHSGYAFAYGRLTVGKPMHGALVIINGVPRIVQL